jgi:hypothetical protein
MPMEPTEDSGDAGRSTGAQELGPHAATILATEHWSLLSARSLIWSEALNRATVFLTVLSASIVALALVVNANGFGSEATEVALVLLPVVLLLGIATYVRLVRINTEEYQLVLAMNRLRYAYLKIEPGLERYFTTGHHDDEKGVMTTYMTDQPDRPGWLVYFLTNTPTIVATVVAALAAVIVGLVLEAPGAPRAVFVAGGVVAFVAVWGALFVLQQRSMDPIHARAPRFPTPTGPPAEPGRGYTGPTR